MSRYALPLSGYEDASIWGYDDQDVTYFATLWRNESDSRDEPDFWLNWFTLNAAIESPGALAYLIGRSTGVPMREVAAAMAQATSAPEHRELAAIAK
jgi:hypothetical protein